MKFFLVSGPLQCSLKYSLVLFVIVSVRGLITISWLELDLSLNTRIGFCIVNFGVVVLVTVVNLLETLLLLSLELLIGSDVLKSSE
ncbi:unnamed protein product [Schistosoma curassoni]|uniref:NADH dehydrogenase subunit 4L n=1 Tax=Schistosoma curassoni TaxID=6186 RepID=A0A183JPI0_9TREM|nr:unnamed protein product [Schistosoma curassoni]